MSELMDIIKDPTMDYQQRCIALAKYAENLEDHIVLSDRTKYFQEKQVVTAMGEGASPYRPRYVTMDFEKFFAQGSKFLELEPPKDIWEAVSDLMIIYHHIPGVTMQPVYIGHLDRLLEPFYTTYEETKRAVKMLLMHLDHARSRTPSATVISGRRTRGWEGSFWNCPQRCSGRYRICP